MFKKRLNSNCLCFDLWLVKYLFVKIIPQGEYQHELSGYELVSQYYPVPRLLFHFSLLGFGFLVFEYEKTLEKAGGQAVDYFALSSDNQDKVKVLFSLYQDVFQKTLTTRTCRVGDPVDIFYRDRINTRLLPWYADGLIQELEGVVVSLNNVHLDLKPSLYIDEAQKYFAETRTLPCIVSQCDPQDLNVGTKPIMLDFRAGGHTPLMAEFASYLWFALAMGNYLAPLLNPATYRKRTDIFSRLDTVEYACDLNGEWRILHVLSERRRWAIREYNSTVLNALLTKYDNWFDDLMPHLTMRALTVFNLSRDREKLMFALAYIAYLRTLKTSRGEEFVEDILTLYD